MPIGEHLHTCVCCGTTFSSGDAFASACCDKCERAGHIGGVNCPVCYPISAAMTKAAPSISSAVASLSPGHVHVPYGTMTLRRALADADLHPTVCQLVIDIVEELQRAVQSHGRFNSAHEGYAVLLEEVDELWEEVRKRRGKRDVSAMRKECIQVAAMAVRFAMEVAR